jgi:cephalosporin hydroxylase
LGRCCVSLRMWKKYFRNGTIFGIDINPRKRRFRFLGLHIFIGSQRDTDFLEHVMQEIGNVDVIIDDGSHNVSDQQISLGALFPYLKSGGYYVIEDLQTSFWSPDNAFDVLPDESNSTFHILKEMKTAGILKSTYLSEDQLKYLRDNIRSCELYAHINERQHSTSMIQKI